ncbi:MAG: hypothetical protein AAGA65_28615 [Actinomycetota bacterium]
MSEKTLGKARGLNSIADPSEFKGSRGRRRGRAEATPPPPPRPEDHADAATTIDVREEPAVVEATPAAPVERPDARPAVPHRAVVPGLQRKRRELSIPVPVADALAATGINPADVVMSAYRSHSDAIFAGAGGRMVSRGRQRLRLSISDAEFDKISRLGEARGWNRSETVAVLLTLELLSEPAPQVQPG